MKAAVATIAISAVALAAPIGAAHARTAVAVQVHTPAFGLRIGAPGVVFASPAVVVPAVPAYVPPPVYAPPLPVAYLPPRVVLRAPIVYPVAYPRPHVHAPVVKHWKHGRKHARRGAVVAGYAYGY